MTSTTLVLRSWLSMMVPSVGLALLAAPWGPWAVVGAALVGWALGLVLIFAVWPKVWR